MTTYHSKESESNESERTFTSTGDRLKELMKTGKAYSNKQSTEFIPETRMFISHCTVVIDKSEYQASAALSIDDPTYGAAACQWVDTVAFGRCLAKAGYGVENNDGFASSEEMATVKVAIPKKGNRNSRQMKEQSKGLETKLNFD